MILPIVVLFPSRMGAAYWSMVVLLLISYITDFADGFFARRFNQRSALGLILDPVADKAWTFALITLLVLHRNLNPGIAALIVFRDLWIIVINVRLLRKTGSIMSSEEFGKTYMVLLGLMIIGMTVSLPFMEWLAKGLLILGLITIIRYTQKYLQLVGNFRGSRLQKTVHSFEEQKIE